MNIISIVSRSIFGIIILICSLFARAQQIIILECTGKSKSAVSSYGFFRNDSYVKINDQTLRVTIGENFLLIEGKVVNQEFKDIKLEFTRYSSTHGYFSTTNSRFDGAYYNKFGETPGTEHKISINRFNGEFEYSTFFYLEDINNSWLGKSAKTNLKEGVVSLVIAGVCISSKNNKLF